MIKRIGIIGAGQMGSGIAHAFAASGFEVRLSDVTGERVEKRGGISQEPCLRGTGAGVGRSGGGMAPPQTARRLGFSRPARAHGAGSFFSTVSREAVQLRLSRLSGSGDAEAAVRGAAAGRNRGSSH